MAKKNRQRSAAARRKQAQRSAVAPPPQPRPIARPPASAAAPTAVAPVADDRDEAGDGEFEPVARAATAPARTASPAAARAASPQPAPVRRVGRVDPAQQRRPVRPARQSSTAAMFEPLDPDDAAIPFDRVPYVPGDLRRVAVIAGAMVVLIVLADVIVSRVVG